MQKQPPEVFYKAALLKDFVTFTGKYMCWSLFLIQNIARFLRASIFEEHMQMAASKYVWMKLIKTENCS